MSIPVFKYFDNPLKNAAYTNIGCIVCGTHTLSGRRIF